MKILLCLLLCILPAAADVAIPQVKPHRNFMGATKVQRDLHRATAQSSAPKKAGDYLSFEKQIHWLLYSKIPPLYEGNDFAQSRYELEQELVTVGPSPDLLARARAWRKNVLAAIGKH